MIQFQPLQVFRVRKVIASSRRSLNFSTCSSVKTILGGGVDKLADVTACGAVGKPVNIAACGGGGKLADVTLLASVSFACNVVAVLLAPKVGTVIAFRLKGQAPAFRNPATAFAAVIVLIQALCRSSENWNFVITRPGCLSIQSWHT